MIVEPSPYLDTTGLTKARKPRKCDYCRCMIQRGELYDRHNSNGPRSRCIVCVTKGQLFSLIALAKDLRMWLDRR